MFEFFKRMFSPGQKPPPDAPDSDAEHALLLHIALSDDNFGTEKERDACFALEDLIEQHLETTGVGELDGNGFGNGECVIFIYGENADQLWTAAKQAVGPRGFPRGTYAIKRYGPARDGVREVRIDNA